MTHRKNKHPGRIAAIHDTVRSDDHLADLRPCDFGDHPPAIREVLELPDVPEQALKPAQRRRRLIRRDLGEGLCRALLRERSPADFHFSS